MTLDVVIYSAERSYRINVCVFTGVPVTVEDVWLTDGEDIVTYLASYLTS